MIKPIPHLLSLELAKRFEPLAEELGVSEVARSERGFFTAYKQAGGDWDALDPWWQNRRNNFVKRHMAQVEMRNEPLFYDDGTPTRRHLGLIMWAHSPLTEKQLEKTMRRKNPPLEWHLENDDLNEVIQGLIAQHGQRAVLDAAFARKKAKRTRRNPFLSSFGETLEIEEEGPCIVRSFSVRTKDSARRGGPIDQFWADEECVSWRPSRHETAIDFAVEYLEEQGATYPSHPEASPGIWYSTRQWEENEDGELEKSSFHLSGFSPEEEIEIALIMSEYED